MDEVGLETTTAATEDIVSIEFIEAGQLAARTVSRVSVMGGSEFGPGFLVGEGLFLTNNHVLDTPQKAWFCDVEFNDEEHKFGNTLPPSEFLIEPERFWLTDANLDFTLIGPERLRCCWEDHSQLWQTNDACFLKKCIRQ